MNYNDLILKYPYIDLVLELFKGVAPTMVALLAIWINNALSKNRDKKAREDAKKRAYADFKIGILKEVFQMYMEISQQFWQCGTNLILFLSEDDSDKRRKSEVDFEQCLYSFQMKSQEIYDYHKAALEQYGFEIGFDTVVKDAKEFSNSLIDICEEYIDCYTISDSKIKNKKLDEARDKILHETLEAKAWTNTTMHVTAAKIKELAENGIK